MYRHGGIPDGQHLPALAHGKLADRGACSLVGPAFDRTNTAGEPQAAGASTHPTQEKKRRRDEEEGKRASSLPQGVYTPKQRA